MLIWWTLICLILLGSVTSICTNIGTLIYWYIFKKSNYFVVVIYNLLIIIPFHLFFSGKLNLHHSHSVDDLSGLHTMCFYMGFIFYLLLFVSHSIHFHIINLMKSIQNKKIKIEDNV